MNDTIKNIYNPPCSPSITEGEFNDKLSRAANGLKVIHNALIENQEGINSIILTDAMEPFLLDLYEIEARYSNYGGFEAKTDETIVKATK